MTEQEVLSKLTFACAKAEHCIYEMKEKMRKWDIDESTQKRVIAYLIKERYIDEERYARFFIKSKKEYNRWGTKKIEAALRMKRIPEEVYGTLLHEICEKDYEDILIPLLQNKRKSVKGNSDYEIRTKLIRFALSRGFEMDQILLALKHLDIEEE